MKRTYVTPYNYLKLISVLAFFCIAMVCPACHVSAQTIIKPYVVSTGSEADLKKATTYRFTSNGNNIYPLKITERGSISMNIRVTDPEFLNIAVYKKKDLSDLPRSISCQCTSYYGNRNTINEYFEKGTYYIRFPENTYDISCLLYSNAGKTLTSGKTIAAYSDYLHPTYFKYKAPADGYIKVTESCLNETKDVPTTVLCNSKKKEITDMLRNHESTDKIVYAVKKDHTYYIKTGALDLEKKAYYRIHLDFEKRKESSGSSKTKAKSIKLGSTVKGTVFSEDNRNKYDWYKFTNPTKQYVSLEYNGSITSGVMLLEVYNSSGKIIYSYETVSWIGEKNKTVLLDKNKKAQLPKGTYYIRISKSKKNASGIYSLKLSKSK